MSDLWSFRNGITGQDRWPRLDGRRGDVVGLGRRPIKILYLIPTLDVGGAEVDLVRIAPRLDRASFEPIIWPFVHHGPLAARLHDAGIPVLPSLAGATSLPGQGNPATRRGNSGSWLRGARLPLAAWRVGWLAAAIARGIRAANPDLVHAILPNAYLFAAVSSLIGRRPLVMSRVSQNWYQEQLPLVGLFERWIAHRVVRIAIGNSVTLVDELSAEGVAEAKLRLVHNGIDVEEFCAQQIDPAAARERLGVAGSPLVLSVVANLHPYKGHADLLHALAMIRDALPSHWRLLIAGRDVAGQRDLLGRLADELGLASHIRFLGERSDVPVVLSAADIHVSASHTEGFPNNILEAMCSGLPVISTAVGGVPEQIEDRRTGILTRPGDLAGLAKAIEMLGHNIAARRRLGEAAREAVRSRFALARTIAGLETIYHGLGRASQPSRACDSDAA
jgi:glycosyltransferase involved in cell wall biosynthesis